MKRRLFDSIRSLIAGRNEVPNLPEFPVSSLRQVAGPRYATRIRHNWKGHTNPPDPRVFTGSGKVLRSIKAFRRLGLPTAGATKEVAS